MTITNDKKIVPIVFSVDDNYAPFLSVALYSIMDNSDKNYFYKVHVLNTGLSDEHFSKISKIAKEYDNIEIEFVCVADRMDKLKDKTHLRDYYTNAIYYRIFIPSLFPDYDKILYIDCDVVFIEDIMKLFGTELGTNIFAAVHEEAMTSFECFGAYSEQFLDVPRREYFNSGLLLINTKEYKKENIEEKFISLMLEHKFEVAPDQDYLNVLCKDKVKLLDVGWNKTPIPEKEFCDEDIKLVHFKLNFKPWHYHEVRYSEYFWKYAIKTPYYENILKMRESFSEQDKKQDDLAFKNLQNMAWRYIESENNYKKMKSGS